MPRPKIYFGFFSLTFDYYEHKVIFHQYSIHFNHAQINVRIHKVGRNSPLKLRPLYSTGLFYVYSVFVPTFLRRDLSGFAVMTCRVPYTQRRSDGSVSALLPGLPPASLLGRQCQPASRCDVLAISLVPGLSYAAAFASKMRACVFEIAAAFTWSPPCDTGTIGVKFCRSRPMRCSAVLCKPILAKKTFFLCPERNRACSVLLNVFSFTQMTIYLLA